MIDAGVIIVMFAMNLPFVEATSGDRSSVISDALPALLLLLPSFAATVIPNHARPLPPPVAWGAIALGLAAFPYSLLKFVDASVVADSVGGSVGLGGRLLVFGVVVNLMGLTLGLAWARLSGRLGRKVRTLEPAAAPRTEFDPAPADGDGRRDHADFAGATERPAPRTPVRPPLEPPPRGRPPLGQPPSQPPPVPSDTQVLPPISGMPVEEDREDPFGEEEPAS